MVFRKSWPTEVRSEFLKVSNVAYTDEMSLSLSIGEATRKVSTEACSSSGATHESGDSLSTGKSTSSSRLLLSQWSEIAQSPKIVPPLPVLTCRKSSARQWLHHPALHGPVKGL